ncbi:MAG: hypothetical protein WKG07_49265 [Hymenobacter sp.]
MRELRNVLERAAILTPPGQPLDVIGLPLEVQLAAAPRGPAAAEDARSLRNAEMQHIRRILLEVRRQQSRGGPRARHRRIATLYRKVQEYGLGSAGNNAAKLFRKAVRLSCRSISPAGLGRFRSHCVEARHCHALAFRRGGRR